LYECVTNAPAFAGGDWLLMQTRILLAVPKLPEWVPRELAGVLDAMLAKDRARRPVDAGEVVALLDRLPGPPAPAPRTARPTPPPPLTLRPPPPACPPRAPVLGGPAPQAGPPNAFPPGPWGGGLQPLHDGAVVIKLAPSGDEPAFARAERCARALHELAPG